MVVVEDHRCKGRIGSEKNKKPCPNFTYGGKFCSRHKEDDEEENDYERAASPSGSDGESVAAPSSVRVEKKTRPPPSKGLADAIDSRLNENIEEIERLNLILANKNKEVEDLQSEIKKLNRTGSVGRDDMAVINYELKKKLQEQTTIAETLQGKMYNMSLDATRKEAQAQEALRVAEEKEARAQAVIDRLENGSSSRPEFLEEIQKLKGDLAAASATIREAEFKLASAMREKDAVEQLREQWNNDNVRLRMAFEECQASKAKEKREWDAKESKWTETNRALEARLQAMKPQPSNNFGSSSPGSEVVVEDGSDSDNDSSMPNQYLSQRGTPAAVPTEIPSRPNLNDLLSQLDARDITEAKIRAIMDKSKSSNLGRQEKSAVTRKAKTLLAQFEDAKLIVDSQTRSVQSHKAGDEKSNEDNVSNVSSLSAARGKTQAKWSTPAPKGSRASGRLRGQKPENSGL